MCGEFKAICVLFLVCLLVTPATLQETQQEGGGKGAKCKNPRVRKIHKKDKITIFVPGMGE